jgi:hypothetical protein
VPFTQRGQGFVILEPAAWLLLKAWVFPRMRMSKRGRFRNFFCEMQEPRKVEILSKHLFKVLSS